MFTHVEIREDRTGMVEHRFDVSGKTDRQLDKFVDALWDRIDTDRFSLYLVDDEGYEVVL